MTASTTAADQLAPEVSEASRRALRIARVRGIVLADRKSTRLNSSHRT